MKFTKAKAIAALVVQTAGQALALGVLPNSWVPYAEALTGAATIVAVFQTKNKVIATQGMSNIPSRPDAR